MSAIQVDPSETSISHTFELNEKGVHFKLVLHDAESLYISFVKDLLQYGLED